MRISIRPSDTGYAAYITAAAHNRKAVVKLNGEPQFMCVTADSDCGMVVRYVKGPDGVLTYDQERQCIVDEVVHGKVIIAHNRKPVIIPDDFHWPAGSLAPIRTRDEPALWSRLFDVPNRLYGATINSEGDAI